MVKRKNILTSDDRAKLVHAVGKIQKQINWKVGKMDDYIERRGFVLLGRIDEVLKWVEEENK